MTGDEPEEPVTRTRLLKVYGSWIYLRDGELEAALAERRDLFTVPPPS